MTDRDDATIVVAFDPARIPARRAAWIAARLRGEIEVAVQRLAAAHPDVPFYLGGDDVVADQRASRMDLLDVAALRRGAVDGRTTAEVAAAIGRPTAEVETDLAHPSAALRRHDDGRWWPNPNQIAGT